MNTISGGYFVLHQIQFDCVIRKAQNEERERMNFKARYEQIDYIENSAGMKKKRIIDKFTGAHAKNAS